MKQIKLQADFERVVFIPGEELSRVFREMGWIGEEEELATSVAAKTLSFYTKLREGTTS